MFGLSRRQVASKRLGNSDLCGLYGTMAAARIGECTLPSPSSPESSNVNLGVKPAKEPSQPSRIGNRRKGVAFRIKQVAMMKSRNDPILNEKPFEVVCEVKEKEGSRVRITLDNGQYFVLKIPQDFDGKFHEITANERYKLETKFAYCNGQSRELTMTYESALAKGNALILLFSLAQALSRREAFSSYNLGVDSLDFYLCCGAMTVLYTTYLVAKSMAMASLMAAGGGKGRNIQVTLRSVEKESKEVDFLDGVRCEGVSATNGSTTTEALPRRGEAKLKAPGSAKAVISKKMQAANEGSRGSGNGQAAAPPAETEMCAPPSRVSPSGVELVPPVETWVHYPVLVRCAPNTPTRVGGILCTPSSQLRINNIPMPFETKLFKGTVMIRIANLADSPEDFFAGRNRKCQVAIQGQFKKRTRFDKLFTGQELYEKVPLLPPKSVVDTIFMLLRSKLPPTFIKDVFCDTPYFLSPLVNTCQGFAVETDETKQNVFGSPKNRWSIVEDTKLLGPEVPRDSEKRRKYFAVASNLEKYWFEPDLFYTFDYFQHFMDMSCMRFIVTNFLGFDCSGIVGRQPLQLSMAKDMDGGGHFWNFEIWHKAFMENAEE